MEADPTVIAQFHNQLVPDLENSDDSGSDEEEDACAGWEAVSFIYIYTHSFLMNQRVIHILNGSYICMFRYQILLVLRWQYLFLVHWSLSNPPVCKYIRVLLVAW